MKYFLLVATLFLFGFYLNAQDIIFFKSGERVECKLIEIFPDEIVYKKASNLAGPNYRVRTDRISKIVFENGEVQVFGQQSSQPVTQQAQTNNPTSTQIGKLSRSRYKLYMNDKQLTNAEVRLLLQSNPVALDYFNKGRALRSLDVSLDIAGSAIIVVGIVAALAAGETALLAISGAGLVIACVPFLTPSAGEKLDVAIAKFNDQFGDNKGKTKLDLRFGFYTNGIGITANF